MVERPPCSHQTKVILFNQFSIFNGGRCEYSVFKISAWSNEKSPNGITRVSVFLIGVEGCSVDGCRRDVRFRRSGGTKSGYEGMEAPSSSVLNKSATAIGTPGILRRIPLPRLPQLLSGKGITNRDAGVVVVEAVAIVANTGLPCVFPPVKVIRGLSSASARVFPERGESEGLPSAFACATKVGDMALLLCVTLLALRPVSGVTTGGGVDLGGLVAGAVLNQVARDSVKPNFCAIDRFDVALAILLRPAFEPIQVVIDLMTS